jgi:hypothetical protein
MADGQPSDIVVLCVSIHFYILLPLLTKFQCFGRVRSWKKHGMLLVIYSSFSLTTLFRS